MTISSEAIADTLAYYSCRRSNPKADHPTMGYHAFSEDQREFLRGEQAEAAAEIGRMVTAALSAVAPHIAAQALRTEADRWDAEYASPIRRSCPACGAKPGQDCYGNGRKLTQAHSQRRGERITPATLRARAVEMEGNR